MECKDGLIAIKRAIGTEEWANCNEVTRLLENINKKLNFYNRVTRLVHQGNSV